MTLIHPPTRRRTRPSPLRTALLLVVSTAVVGILGSRAWAAVSAADRTGAPDAADGFVPDGVTVFDDQYPAVANLDAGLRAALRRAARDAARDGITVVVNSGWRSPAYQQQLLVRAISRYGSAAEAARWVATPTTSVHVAGRAVDLGPAAATEWLSRYGAGYGLCQIYRNEPWHYELRPEASVHGCPPMYADAAHDPRLHR